MVSISKSRGAAPRADFDSVRALARRAHITRPFAAARNAATHTTAASLRVHLEILFETTVNSARTMSRRPPAAASRREQSATTTPSAPSFLNPDPLPKARGQAGLYRAGRAVRIGKYVRKLKVFPLIDPAHAGFKRRASPTPREWRTAPDRRHRECRAASSAACGGSRWSWGSSSTSAPFLWTCSPWRSAAVSRAGAW